MTFIPDLSPCTYLPVQSDLLLSIGWLGRGQDFSRGPVSPEFYAKLKRFCSAPWQPWVAPGLYECELCQFEPARMTGEIYIPHNGRIYVAPVGIVHYIARHWYQPPSVFIEAVSACPAFNTIDYKRALLEHGGRGVLVGRPG